MDRDFVLQLRAPQAEHSFAIGGVDGEEYAAIASFRPSFSGPRTPKALSLGVVIDCSGSMAGISMEQAKRALDDILQRLEPSDRVNIVAFGSHVRVFAQSLVACTEENRASARHFVQDLDANMGGTEVQPALEAVRRSMHGVVEETCSS